ncbi:ATP-binding protein [Streptomyces sp. WZ-12]|uniref:ATP-binding protein n=1 Tax=Streptomyces sp. WZ-12 TaxID=3030210 RepID=UPI002381629E|nr:ATP-binding protein [Streptomyces sp. WZ-12]
MGERGTLPRGCRRCDFDYDRRREPMTITMTAARPRATGYPGYNTTHPCVGEAAAAARRLVRTACATWGLEGHAEIGALIISELVANAVRHTTSHSIRVIVDRPAATQLRLAVVDKDPYALPVLRFPGDEDERGRGLLLVDRLSERWGCDVLGSAVRPWGKRSWAELRIAGGPDNARSPV